MQHLKSENGTARANEMQRFFKRRVFSPLGIDNGEAWVAGGACRQWLQTGDVPNDCDFDLWCRNSSDANAVIERALERGCKETSRNSRVVNLRTTSGAWIQVVMSRYFESLEETVNSFDFTVCRFGITPGGRFVFDESAFEDLAMMRLNVRVADLAADSLYRAFKYSRKGFRICGGNVQTLVKEIVRQANSGELDINNSDSWYESRID